MSESCKYCKGDLGEIKSKTYQRIVYKTSRESEDIYCDNQCLLMASQESNLDVSSVCDFVYNLDGELQWIDRRTPAERKIEEGLEEVKKRLDKLEKLKNLNPYK